MHLLRRDHAHGQPTAAVGLQQPLLLEVPQRLAQGAAAHRERLAELDLGEVRARRQLPVGDRLAHSGERELAERLPVDVADRAERADPAGCHDPFRAGRPRCRALRL
ncbi:hypothetical protein GCM10025874_15380 [Arenivirga flava]|uniref:Uncharacterized protein n=1 Tax=Arenivirga flava TaxID=1930060 RepID=A0AA37UEV0_9MICO|nr:hypothetical protein GCM10025874_15380 [Arenivirga flava]